ncbi:hypothetical protein AURDEDRAFT_168329 [Auricularia subglabra TFB-10046 SS5]|nr:hypothetical protein AURDEDRAFT_168329 [Auricularia subglabra TFB-10046 SS5]
MDAAQLDIVKSAIRQHGSAEFVTGRDVTVVSLRVGDEVVARFKLASTDNPDTVSDLVSSAVNDPIPCYVAMPEVLRQLGQLGA